MSLSMGFSVPISRTRCHPSYGVLTLAPAGLFLPLNTPAFAGRTKIILKRQLADLGMQYGDIYLGSSRIILALAADTCGAFLKTVLPLRDLVRMHIKLLRKLSQSLVALESGQSHLRFKCCCVVPARSSAHLLSSFRHFRRLGNRASTSPAVRISGTGSYHRCREAFGTTIEAPSIGSR